MKKDSKLSLNKQTLQMLDMKIIRGAKIDSEKTANGEQCCCVNLSVAPVACKLD